MAPLRTKCFDVDSPTHSDHSEASESAEGPVQKVSAFKPYARPSASTQSGFVAAQTGVTSKGLKEQRSGAFARASLAYDVASAPPRQTGAAAPAMLRPEPLVFMTPPSLSTYVAVPPACSPYSASVPTYNGPLSGRGASQRAPSNQFPLFPPFDPLPQFPQDAPPQPTGRNEASCLAPCLTCQRPWSTAEEHRFVEIVSMDPTYQIILLLPKAKLAQIVGLAHVWSSVALKLCPSNPRTPLEMSQRWNDIGDDFHNLQERLAPSGREKTLAQLAKCTRAYQQRLHFCSINSWFEIYHAMLLNLPNVIEAQKQIKYGASRVQGASPAAAAAAAVATGNSPFVNAAAALSSFTGPAAASSSAQPSVFTSSSTDAAAKEERAHQLAVLSAQNEQRRTELEIAKLNVRRGELVLAREEKARVAARQVATASTAAAAAAAAAAKPNVAVDEEEEEREHPEWVDEFVKSQTLVFVALMDRFDEVDEAIEEVRNKQRYP